MWSWLTIVDIALAFYFLFIFEPSLLGYPIALILLYRVVKDGWATGDHLVIDMRKKKNTQ